MNVIKICKYCLCVFKTRKNYRIYCGRKCYKLDNAEKFKSQFKKHATNDDGKPYNYDYNKIRNCIVCNKKLHHCSRTGYCAEHYHTDAHKKKMSDSMKNTYRTGVKVPSYCCKNMNNGYKKGYYKGFWCDSSWELAYVIYNLEHNIIFQRNVEPFKYQWENEVHRWFPDFIVNGVYFEIKGYITNKDLAKWKDFKYPLTILRKKEMQYIFEYVESVYGKDFSKLYETNSSESSAGMRATV